MDKGRTEQIIEKLIDSVEAGQSVPFAAGKVAVNKDETIMMLKELESIVNGELKIYREFNDRKGKIINDAKKEAEEIIYEAEQTASRIRVTKRMSTIGTAFRAESLDPEDKQALRTAGDIYAASLIYTDEMLTEVNDVVAQAYDLVVNQYGRMINTLQEKAELIAKNKAELMTSLKELSKEDRYTQILELGQLLSYELYNEKMKAREMETNGSYQMEMMFEEQVAATAENTQALYQQTMPREPGPSVGTVVDGSAASAPLDSYQPPVEEEIPVDSAFAESAPVDSAFVDSAFAESVPVDSAFVDSAFAESAPVDSAFVDSAFVETMPEANYQEVRDPGPSVGTIVDDTVEAAPMDNHQEIREPGPSVGTIEDDSLAQPHSIEAVSKTLEMFKNYKPGSGSK